MVKVQDAYGRETELSLNCSCNGDGTGKVGLASVLLLTFFTYYLVTHLTPDFRKWHDYFSNILGARKLRFIPRSELDAPQITHITEEMDINPYSFFPSKDLM
ncbi:hypothetical protein BBBOND_0312080 [Babesia bigemina]|uniref:Uncharacterized protein n=1 Tax=Babesia bigemina TaxID=5866 RepID=A0A061DEH8_BABBI|nr:hypothetical protein BBBOND_0312080 [Babesia bigemina]CDR97305.1 hypothetical protein BBBOND_0312080 [Babesia bigemina]|eukprot:XP_012769491.1 hypothetical protein BBBOND_0312080 [Babesia bigemina]